MKFAVENRGNHGAGNHTGRRNADDDLRIIRA